MSLLSVGLISTVGDQLTQMQNAVEGSGLGRVLLKLKSFPTSGDSAVAQVADIRPDVIIVSMRQEETSSAVKTMELLRAEVPNSVVIAVGDMRQSQNVIMAMRAGAREFLDTPVTQPAISEAFTRIATSLEKSGGGLIKYGQVFAVIGAKGGSGATTVAVNLALALQANSGPTVIVDLAVHGHVALHLNVRPKYSAFDALLNSDRLDRSLLESYVMKSTRDVKVLAGLMAPTPAGFSAEDVEKLLSLLAQTHANVVVDLSSRLDNLSRAVCNAATRVLIVSQTDVPSIWSVNQIIGFLSMPDGPQKTAVMLNRYRKIAGYSDSDLESAYGAKIVGKLPGNYEVVCRAIDRGLPVLASKNELTPVFEEVFNALTKPQERNSKGFSFLGFSTA